MSGSITITPGKTLAAGEKITRAKLNQGFAPTGQLDAGSVTSRELDADAVRQIVPSVYRNLLINGAFNVWQRGGYATAALYGLPTTIGAANAPVYGADRWYMGRPGAINMRRVSQGVFTPGQTSVPGEPRYFLKWEQLINQAPTPCLSQQIEDARTMAGKTVTVSGYLKANKSLNITVKFIQMFDPSEPSALVGTGQTVSIIGNAAWARFEKTFVIPTLAGRTLSAAIYDDSYLECRWEMPVNDTYEVDYAELQMEEGGVATPFEVIAAHDDHARAERFFEYHACMVTSSVATLKPSFYYATRKRTPVVPTVVGTPSGTGVTFLGLVDTGYYQNTAHSVIEQIFVAADAEFYP